MAFGDVQKITPLFEITPTPEPRPTKKNPKPRRRVKTTAEEATFRANKIAKCWKYADLPIMLDVEQQEGQDALAMLLNTLHERGYHCIPVVSPSKTMAYKTAAVKFSRRMGRGICFRVPLEFLFNPNLGDLLATFLDSAAVPASSVYLLLDLGHLNRTPDAERVMALVGVINSLPHLQQWRMLALAGGSFVQDLTDFKAGVHSIDRSEWRLWKLLTEAKGIARKPLFSDYGVQHPSSQQAQFRGSANIRYAIDGTWLVFKGLKVNEAMPSRSGVHQFRNLCKKLCADPRFCTREFSWSDEHIHDCANGFAQPSSSATFWRTVGTHHHVTFVVRQICGAL